MDVFCFRNARSSVNCRKTVDLSLRLSVCLFCWRIILQPNNTKPLFYFLHFFYYFPICFIVLNRPIGYICNYAYVIYLFSLFPILRAAMQQLMTPKHWSVFLFDCECLCDVKYIMFVKIKCYFCIKYYPWLAYSSTIRCGYLFIHSL